MKSIELRIENLEKKMNPQKQHWIISRKFTRPLTISIDGKEYECRNIEEREKIIADFKAKHKNDKIWHIVFGL